MNVLIVGSGGREHAIAWKLAQSQKINSLFIAPGNAGTRQCGTNLQVDTGNFEQVRQAVTDNNINMVIVGPEVPLADGIHDFFLDDPILRQVPVIGPVKKAAMLEGSKDFAKDFLSRHNIPTARYKSFDRTTLDEAAVFMRSLTPPYVIKADGLAAGKGVVIAGSLEDAEDEVRAMVNGKFGTAGSTVVIEQFLRGIELSVFIITDGKSYKILPAAKDYKRIGAGDTGLNTGGMGAVSPVPFADGNFIDKVKSLIIDPTVRGLISDGIEYKGFLYFGLMNVNGDPYVIEFNVRMGDPEAEAVIPRIKSDLFDLFEGVAQGNLAEKELITDNRFVATVMLVSGGYPGTFTKGYPVSGLESVSECVVFHAGTKMAEDKIVTSGGRVMAISSWGDTMKEALEGAYKNASRIHFDYKYYRSDIGFDL